MHLHALGQSIEPGKVVSRLSIQEYEQLSADFELVVRQVNAASGDYVDKAVQSEALDCPVCNAVRAFTIDENNPAAGYCVAEDVIHTIKAINIAECAFCKLDTPILIMRNCLTCSVNWCTRGEDDDRFCVIAHENMHEDRAMVN